MVVRRSLKPPGSEQARFQVSRDNRKRKRQAKIELTFDGVLLRYLTGDFLTHNPGAIPQILQNARLAPADRCNGRHNSRVALRGPVATLLFIHGRPGNLLERAGQ
jgi:hypothetical protein